MPAAPVLLEPSLRPRPVAPNVLALEPPELVDLVGGQARGCDQVEQVAVEIHLGAQHLVGADLALSLRQDEAVGGDDKLRDGRFAEALLRM